MIPSMISSNIIYAEHLKVVDADCENFNEVLKHVIRTMLPIVMHQGLRQVRPELPWKGHAAVATIDSR